MELAKLILLSAPAFGVISLFAYLKGKYINAFMWLSVGFAVMAIAVMIKVVSNG